MMKIGLMYVFDKLYFVTQPSKQSISRYWRTKRCTNRVRKISHSSGYIKMQDWRCRIVRRYRPTWLMAYFKIQDGRRMRLWR